MINAPEAARRSGLRVTSIYYWLRRENPPFQVIEIDGQKLIDEASFYTWLAARITTKTKAMTVAQACRKSGQSIDAIYRLTRAENPPFKLVKIGRRKLIDEASFDAWLVAKLNIKPKNINAIEAARRSGFSRQYMYQVMAYEPPPFQIVTINNHKLIDAESFEAWLATGKPPLTEVASKSGAINVLEATRRSGVSYFLMCRLRDAENPPFKVLKIGRRKLIEEASFEAWLAEGPVTKIKTTGMANTINVREAARRSGVFGARRIARMMDKENPPFQVIKTDGNSLIDEASFEAWLTKLKPRWVVTK